MAVFTSEIVDTGVAGVRGEQNKSTAAVRVLCTGEEQEGMAREHRGLVAGRYRDTAGSTASCAASTCARGGKRK